MYVKTGNELNDNNETGEMDVNLDENSYTYEEQNEGMPSNDLMSLHAQIYGVSHLNTDAISTPMGYHHTFQNLTTNLNMNVLPTGHVTGKGYKKKIKNKK